jgi:hypothetical protein
MNTIIPAKEVAAHILAVIEKTAEENYPPEEQEEGKRFLLDALSAQMFSRPME